MLAAMGLTTARLRDALSGMPMRVTLAWCAHCLRLLRRQCRRGGVGMQLGVH
jgi:hypothetical protein